MAGFMPKNRAQEIDKRIHGVYIIYIYIYIMYIYIYKYIRIHILCAPIVAQGPAPRAPALSSINQSLRNSGRDILVFCVNEQELEA